MTIAAIDQQSGPSNAQLPATRATLSAIPAGEVERVGFTVANTNSELLVYGSSEFGQVLRELAPECGYRFAGYIDDVHTGEEILGSFESARRHLDPRQHSIAVAIGYRHMKARAQIAEQVRIAGFSLATMVHPTAIIAPSATLGPGVIVMAGACIDMRVYVGALTVIWACAVISHDTVLAGNSFVSPNATICGHCRLGPDCFIGAGSTVVDHVDVPAGTFLKANAVLGSAQKRRPITPTPR